MQTFRCPIACPHCLIDAGPHRTEEMCYENSIGWIDQAKNYRGGYIQGLALTGGEPFYILDILKKVSNHGKDLRFTVSAVTSAFWATSIKKAIKVLKNLPAIRLLCISTDQYHQKFIPFENIYNVAYEAEQLNIFTALQYVHTILKILSF